MNKKRIFWGLILMLFSTLIQAKELWGSSGIALLYGTDYEVPMTNASEDKKRYVVSIDRASFHDWGNVYTFLDVTRSFDSGENNNLYGEFSPRVSIYYLTDKARPKGFITDALLASAIEYGASANGNNQMNYLIGTGVNFNVPGIKFLTLNGYRRFNQRYKDNWQLTPVWAAPFSLGKEEFVFTGWADYSTKVGNKPHNLHSQIQLLWDFGQKLWHKPNTFLVGTEYKYWKNKFGITGITETAWQAVIMARY